MTRLMIRGYIGNQLQFAEPVEIPDDEIDTRLPQLAEEHVRRLAGHPHMIEIEFLDEKNLNERFFRFGTDPSLMVKPLGFIL